MKEESLIKQSLVLIAQLLGVGLAILVVVEVGGDLLRGRPDGSPVDSAMSVAPPSPISAGSPAEFAERADLAITVARRDVQKHLNARGLVQIAAGSGRTPVRANALYVAAMQRLDLTLRYPITDGPSGSSWIELTMSIPNYGGVGSYPIRTHKGGVDASAHARQVVLHTWAADTGITGLSGYASRQDQFENGFRWLRDGRLETFDDIGGAIHVLEVGNGRLLAEVSAVLYSREHVAPGFAGHGEREGRASVSGRIEFKTLNEVPR